MWNFTRIVKTQVKFWKFHVYDVICEFWHSLPRASISNILLCYYRWLITSLVLEQCKKECSMLRIILVEGFWSLKINIIQFPDWFHRTTALYHFVREITSGTFDPGLSDHCLVYGIIKLQCKRTPPKYISASLNTFLNFSSINVAIVFMTSESPSLFLPFGVLFSSDPSFSPMMTTCCWMIKFF